MSSVTEADGSEDVADFLERIRALSDKKIREDEERTKKLEAEILRGRQERQARRAERAKSVSQAIESPLDLESSPLRSIPSTPTTVARTSIPSTPASATKLSTPTSFTESFRADERLDARMSTDPLNLKPPTGSTTISRSGTLSWQQRPSPKAAIQARFARDSQISLEGLGEAVSNKEAEPHGGKTEKSMSERAQLLGDKDPSWFRQTADRGIGSPAFRRAQDSPGAEGSKVKLHGLSSGSSDEPPIAKHHALATAKEDEERRPVAGLNLTKSPMPLLSSQMFDPPSSQGDLPLSSRSTTDTSRGRISPVGRTSPERAERTPSPTKGLGGFVQSAMMKRSDSVSKRWSAQSGQGLSRGNSLTGRDAGARGLNINMPNSAMRLEFRSSGLSRGTSPEPQPESADQPHSNATNSGPMKDVNPQTFPANDAQDVARESTFAPSSPKKEALGSQSKTFETKRWSPTKASWLETAINRPEPSKPKMVTPQQPSWMVDLNKAKQARASQDSGNLASQQSAAASKQSTQSDSATPPLKLTPKPSPSVESRRPPLDERTGGTESLPKVLVERSAFTPLQDPPEPVSSLSQQKNAADDIEPKQGNSSSPSPIESPRTPNLGASQYSSRMQKSKPDTPPKKDFRSTLKSRQIPAEKADKEEAEFRNVFGRLKRTETKNYVAPNELKDNVLRGKAALNVTGGPQKQERKDEFKESILKKKEDMKAGTPSIGRKPSVESPQNPSIPEAITKRRALSTRPDLVAPNTIKPSIAENTGVLSEKTKTGQRASLEKNTITPAKLQSLKTETDIPEPPRQDFNTTLANILSRGPVTVFSEGQDTSRAESSSNQFISEAPPKQDSQLTHVTKSRARGPKRRPPMMKGSQENSAKPASSVSANREHTLPYSPKEPDITSERIGKFQLPSPAPFPSTSSNNKAVMSSAEISSSPAVMKPEKPAANPKLSYPLSPDKAKQAPSGPKPMFQKKSSQEIGFPNQSLEGNISLPLEAPAKSPRSPPIPAKKIELSRIVSNGSSIATKSTSNPSKPGASETLRIIKDFFEDVKGTAPKIEIDTQAIVSNPPRSSDKIRTFRKEICEISADGKKKPVPASMEHILFEDKMYLCTHVFGTSTGHRTTEVYLWSGDNVSSAAVDDVQIFCRNFAKDVGGKLIVLSQGKESSNFFEALGGIVITRKSSSSSTGPVPYMLSGRRHMSHIAFDETEFSSANLCSGFPHVIADSSGKLYLWKGKGSNTDEIGCARLVGGDLGATGEIEEVEESKEPSEFLSVFKRSSRQGPPEEHWPLKAKTEKYKTRLFMIDTESRPKSSSGFSWGRRPSGPSNDTISSSQIKEISPFTQNDLARDHIFVLDTFFEVLVVVGASTNNKYTDFHVALLFAQEYAILAASHDDRPFVPKSTVVLEGIPESMKPAFRKWEDGKVSTRSPVGSGAFIMDVDATLEATSLIT